MLRVGIVAGEASGDSLGSELIRACKELSPDIKFEGIGGPLMESAGCNILFPYEKLAVMGFIEVAARYLELVSIRRKLVSHFLSNPPDIFIGIDAPDFNLSIEQELKGSGVKTVHFVGPTVWAWRSGRLKKIKKAVDLMLVLFPFEVPIYRDYGINVKFIGHPATENFFPIDDKAELKQKMELDPDEKIIAIMPGSRKTEIDKILPIQLEVVRGMHRENPKLVFISSVLTQDDMDMMNDCFSSLMVGQDDLNYRVFSNQSKDVLSVADVGLLTSGTITLEAMLCQLPMAVMYRMNGLSYKIIKSMVKIKYSSLPNLLAGKEIVPEFLQDECEPEKIIPVILGLLKEESWRPQLSEFEKIASLLKQERRSAAAHEILGLMK